MRLWGYKRKELADIQKLLLRFRKKSKLYHLKKLAGYIQRNRDGIWYKEAREKGISIGAGSADKAGDILICRRWERRSHNPLLKLFWLFRVKCGNRI